LEGSEKNRGGGAKDVIAWKKAVLLRKLSEVVEGQGRQFGIRVGVTGNPGKKRDQG